MGKGKAWQDNLQRRSRHQLVPCRCIDVVVVKGKGFRRRRKPSGKNTKGNKGDRNCIICRGRGKYKRETC